LHMFKVFLQLLKSLKTMNWFGVRYWFFILNHIKSGEVTSFSMELPEAVSKVVAAIQNEGFIPLIVGGSVRDLLYSGTRYEEPPKDFDIEVYGCTPTQLIEILEQCGTVDIFGARFGVIKLFIDGIDLDLSVPRIDNKVGSGKTGFETQFDLSMMPDRGSKRRDFTINSLMYDPRGYLLDFNNGVNDITEGVIRATSSQLEEDPTRLYRGLQFATRKGLVPDELTQVRLKSMMKEHSDIKLEMIWEEWKKFFLKGVDYKAGFQFLLDTKLEDLYPEIAALRGCQQDPTWHPEGEVWIHTILVMEAMREICMNNNIKGDDKLVLMIASLCHDFGKPSTTVMEDGKWRSIGHCEAGAGPTVDFLNRINCPESIAKKVIPLVIAHLDHASFKGTNPSRSALGKLKQRIYPAQISELVHLVAADKSGRNPLPACSPIANWLQLEKDYGLDMPKFVGLISGKDLIDAGLRPGKHFTPLINLCTEAELRGEFNDHEEALVWLKAYLENISV
jgi:tRNA nucleotidyltransferase (CCA-adding enzyme)